MSRSSALTRRSQQSKCHRRHWRLLYRSVSATDLICRRECLKKIGEFEVKIDEMNVDSSHTSTQIELSIPLRYDRYSCQIGVFFEPARSDQKCISYRKGILVNSKTANGRSGLRDPNAEEGDGITIIRLNMPSIKSTRPRLSVFPCH